MIANGTALGVCEGLWIEGWAYHSRRTARTYIHMLSIIAFAREIGLHGLTTISFPRVAAPWQAKAQGSTKPWSWRTTHASYFLPVSRKWLLGKPCTLTIQTFDSHSEVRRVLNGYIVGFRAF